MVLDADLQQAGSRHERAQLIQAELNKRTVLRQDMEFTNLDITRVCFDYLDLKNRSFKNVTGYLPSLRKANLRRTDWTGAVLEGAFFSYSNLEKAKFDGATLTHVHFWRCNLNGASFKGATLIDCDFEDVDLAQVRMSGATLVRPRGIR